MRVFIVALLTALALALGHVAEAAELSVSQYCELTVARLQLALDSWQRDGRSPAEAELSVLWQQYGVAGDEYYRFATDNRTQLEDYLASRPDVAQEIERLSASLRAAIQQRDPQ